MQLFLVTLFLGTVANRLLEPELSWMRAARLAALQAVIVSILREEL